MSLSTDADSACRRAGRWQAAAANVVAKMSYLGLLALLWVLAPLPGVAAEVAVPPLRSPVTDLTGTLTANQAAALEQKLRAFEARKGSQVAVLLVPTTAPETIEQYSIRVAEQWRIGRGQADDGVVLLVAKDDRVVRIEVGYGVEGAIPDVLANRIVDQVIVPRFRQGQFAEGIDEGVDRIIALLDGEPLPEVEQRGRSSQGQGIGTLLPLLLMFVFVGSGLVRRMFGGLGGASIMGGVAATIAWALTSAIAIAVGAAIIAFLFTLLGGGGGGGGFGGGMGGWTRGRGGWGGGGFGGGGGGWSGGGGGFGGGGASGRW